MAFQHVSYAADWVVTIEKANSFRIENECLILRLAAGTSITINVTAWKYGLTWTTLVSSPTMRHVILSNASVRPGQTH